ncbi:hypothetical protein ACFUAG_32250 [Streptomyces sp. NPDC057193]|uniref:hypothetical protein n=1 Tax=Streptomyces sp. NPDC057193 TaxID=3346043 RepID=UPI0036294DE1
MTRTLAGPGADALAGAVPMYEAGTGAMTGPGADALAGPGALTKSLAEPGAGALAGTGALTKPLAEPGALAGGAVADALGRPPAEFGTRATARCLARSLGRWQRTPHCVLHPVPLRLVRLMYPVRRNVTAPGPHEGNGRGRPLVPCQSASSSASARRASR